MGFGKRASRKLIESVYRNLDQAMRELGFLKKSDGFYEFIVTSEFEGVIVLSRSVGMRNGALEVTCYPALRNRQYMEICKCVTTKLHAGMCDLAYSENIGYLMPENKFQGWIFEEGKDHVNKVKRIVRVIKKYGMPFLKSNASLKKLARILRAEWRTWRDSNILIKLAIIEFLLNNKAMSKKLMFEVISNAVVMNKKISKKKPSRNLAIQAYYKIARKFFMKYFDLNSVETLDTKWKRFNK